MLAKEYKHRQDYMNRFSTKYKGEISKPFIRKVVNYLFATYYSTDTPVEAVVAMAEETIQLEKKFKLLSGFSEELALQLYFETVAGYVIVHSKYAENEPVYDVNPNKYINYSSYSDTLFIYYLLSALVYESKTLKSNRATYDLANEQIKLFGSLIPRHYTYGLYTSKLDYKKYALFANLNIEELFNKFCDNKHNEIPDISEWKDTPIEFMRSKIENKIITPSYVKKLQLLGQDINIKEITAYNIFVTSLYN